MSRKTQKRLDDNPSEIAATFDAAIGYPESDRGSYFQDNLVDGNVEPGLRYLGYLVGRETLIQNIPSVFTDLGIHVTPLEPKFTQSGAETGDMSYDFYSAYMSKGFDVSLSSKMGVTLNKKGGIQHLPVYMMPSYTFGGEFDTNIGRPDIVAFTEKFGNQVHLRNVWLHELYKKTGKLGWFIPADQKKLTAYANKQLCDSDDTDNVFTVMDIIDVEDVSDYAKAVSYIKGFRIHLSSNENGVWENFLRVHEEYLKEGVSVFSVAGNFSHIEEFEVYVTMDLEIPKDAAEYMSQKVNGDIQNLHIYLTDNFNYSTGISPDPALPVNGIETVIENTKDLPNIPKVNADGVTIAYSGAPLYIPKVFDLKNYNKYKEDFNASLIKDKSSTTFIPDAVPREAISGMQNVVLYADWTLDALIYTNTSGNVQLLDLKGAQPLRDSYYYQLLDSKFPGEKNHTPFKLNVAFRILETIARSIGLDMMKYLKGEDFVKFLNEPTTQTEGFLKSFSENPVTALSDYVPVASRYSGNADKLAWGNLNDKNYSLLYFLQACARLNSIAYSRAELSGKDSSEFSPRIDTVGDVLNLEPFWGIVHRIAKAVNKKIGGDYTPFIGGKNTISTTMTVIPFIIFMAKYKDRTAISKVWDEFRTKYPVRALDDEYKVNPVPNIKDGICLLPHQVKVDSILSENPENAEAAVAAGGGKTIMNLMSCIRAMERGERPLVISPNYLISNYIEDLVYVSGGKVNVFPIDNSVYNRFGEEKLREMILNAPPNTLFVSGLQPFSTGKNVEMSYLGKSLEINQIVEFMRTIKWDVMYSDESHKTANETSKVNRSMARLVSCIDRKRQTTGTYINSTMKDAFGQSKLMDPSIFGTDDEFNSKYGETFRGSNVVLWKNRAERDIRKVLSETTEFIYVPRREWAALLPDKHEQFYEVSLTEEQNEVYKALLLNVMEEIKRDEKMMALLNSNSEDNAEWIESQLKTYLAKIERFISCPKSVSTLEGDSDSTKELRAIGDRLEGEDAVSPKVHVINKILQEHFSDPETRDGKVLIFTSYRASAEHIYNHLEEEFKRMAIHYVAENKAELIPMMKRDKTKFITVGVEASLNTGHNFQQYNRIIRVETLWNPGTLEQAESRVFRPNVKNKETRKGIWLDWIIAKDTIDVTKTARLISKIISAAKFASGGDPMSHYDNLRDLPLVSMTFDTIFAKSSFETTLKEYIDTYNEFKTIERAEFAEYRELTKDLKPQDVPNGGIMKGSAYVKMPYYPGMVLPYQEDLGLVPLTDMALDYGVSLSSPEFDTHLEGKSVHTEFGDGKVVRTSKNKVTVLINGKRYSVDKTVTFLKKKPKLDIDAELQTLIGLPVQTLEGKPLGKPKVKKVVDKGGEVKTEIEPVKTKRTRKAEVPAEEEIEPEINLFLQTINNFIAVCLDGEDDEEAKIAKKLKMVHLNDYWYVEIRNRKRLQAMIAALEEKFFIPTACRKKLQEVEDLFTQGRTRLLDNERASKTDLKNFYLTHKRMVPRGTLYVYPSIEEGQLYLIVPFASKQPSAKQLKKVIIPGCRWHHDDEGLWAAFFTKKTEARDFLKNFTKKTGYQISNMDEVKEEYKAIREKSAKKKEQKDK